MRHRLGITMGDAAGCGSEIVVRALGSRDIYESCIPLVYGDLSAVEDAVRFLGSGLKVRVIASPEEAAGEYGTLDLINLDLLSIGDWEYKKNQASSGNASFEYIVRAIKDAMAGRIHGVVTAPISKEAIAMAGHKFAGHTEIFAHYTGTDSYGMLLTGENLRVIHVTTHISMRDACDLIRDNPDRVAAAIELAYEAMDQLGIGRPRIAVAGLNAHSSENGLFGTEEEVSIIPAIERCRAKGMDVTGPVPPDTVFVKAMGGAFDVVVAMYHDQGHIPLKLAGFHMDAKTGKYSAMKGVNATIGLPIIRTSVDHGTAYGKAGDGRANEGSLVDAIEMAVVMAKKRFPLDGQGGA